MYRVIGFSFGVLIDTPTINDLAGLIIESKGWFDEMNFEEHGNAWEYDSVVEWWTDVLTTDNHDIVVARDGNRIVGASVVCYINKFRWHKGPIHACELVHHAAPDLPTVTRCRIMIELLKAIMEKMKIKGAEFYKIGYDPQFPTWGDYLSRHGFIDSNHVLIAKIT